jgi:hypothetical protein
LVRSFDIRAAHDPVAERRDSPCDHNQIGPADGAVHHRGSGNLTDLNVSGNQREHAGGAAREVDEFRVESVLLEEARFLANDDRQRISSGAAVSHVDFDRLRRGGGGRENPG